MKQVQLQQQLLEIILQRFPKRSLAVARLSELLQVSNDAIYRRIRGDTLLAPDEISLLATRFNVSIDNLINDNEQQILFTFNPFEQEVTGFEVYIDQLLSAALHIRELPEVELFYSVQELPIFLLPDFPQLMTFRMYVYGFNYWKFDFLENMPFRPDLMAKSTLDKARQVNRIYNEISSHELWNLSLIDNTLNQIEYLATIGRFGHIDQIRALFVELEAVIDHLQTMAKYGKKFIWNTPIRANAADFDLYYNEFARTTDSLLISSPERKILFTSFGSPDFLSTQNQRFCLHLENWFRTIISRSTSISSHSERKRDWFFRHLVQKVKQTQEKLEVLYDY
ncbi:MAG: hypothetical protein KDD15_26685 [Lewinella sp.]|nr:hypothetical protein [Lewinella sp.]